MRDPRTDPELMVLIRRFVAPGRRYMRLGGSSLQLRGPERELFMRELAQAAAEITPAELGILLEGGWRERRTACWLIAVAGRTEFRGRIGELLVAGGGPYGGAFCHALATFGTSADADLVCRYLDRHLPQPDLVWDQTHALSTLLHLDAVLGTDRAAPYLAPGGLWQRWTETTPNSVRDPYEYRRIVAQLCAFTTECTDLHTSASTGL
ncbi:DUF6000 family protein [Streptomyces bambusae]|uniref:DUF6000 family protein n=1 Tax=Streptomyces bambusae TaxID=1550616 RepID=UPI001CFEE6BD|nr:DUF6000 family protein [Streptomyces bambusae]MCB5164976.1 DUF6000 family protein [Streptomyces bambusae]